MRACRGTGRVATPGEEACLATAMPRDERGLPVGAEEAQRPRSKTKLLTDATFGPFFVGHLLSTIGMWVHSVAAAIVVYQLTASATLVGVVTAGQFLPQLVLAPWSGARADRADRRRQMITGRVVAGTGSGGLAVVAMLSPLEGTVGAVLVIFASTVTGVGFVLGGPAMQALLPRWSDPRN